MRPTAPWVLLPVAFPGPAGDPVAPPPGLHSTMQRFDALRLQTLLLELNRRALGDHRLEAESQRARREFFGDNRAEASPTQELRFLEWFLLERERLALAAVPIDVLARDGDEGELLESTAGVYRIETVHAHGVEARDVQDDEAILVRAPAGALVAGDLMVGRLYVGGRDGWQPSAAVAVYRPGEAIAAAFARDLQRLDLDRRLSQLELEHLLLRRRQSAPMTAPAATAPAPRPVRPIEHLEAELESILVAGGTEGLATEVSEALAQADRPGVVIGPVLEQLAFDTQVDLERARRALIELWNAHHADALAAAADAADGPAEDPGPARVADSAERVAEDDLSCGLPGESLGERLVRTLDQGLGKKQDLSELFRQLEAMAGIESDEEDEDDDALLFAPAPSAVAASRPTEAIDDDYDGDFGPLVAEFVWETGCGDTGTADVLQLWVGLQRNAALPRTDFDQITGQDLMRLLLHVYLRAEPTQRAEAVRGAFGAVERFSAWAEATQELSLRTAIEACQGTLLTQVDRLQAVGLRLTRVPASTAAVPEVLRVEEVAKDGFGVSSDEGSHWITADAATAALLRAEDLLLGAVETTGDDDRLAGPVVALPSDAQALIG